MKFGTNSTRFTAIGFLVFVSILTCWSQYDTDEIENIIQEETESFMAENELEMISRKESSARDWLSEVNHASRWWNENVSLATWNYETNITRPNSEKLASLSGWFDQWTLHQAKFARKYSKSNYNFDRDTFRQLKLWSMSATPEDTDILKRIYSESDAMIRAYSRGKVCRDSKCLPLEPDLLKIMTDSRDPDELLWAWQGWRNATGRTIRNNFKIYVQLMNLGAKENGYQDFGDYLRTKHYEFSSFIERLSDKLWQEMKPLYTQLHTYVRRRLQRFYGPAVFEGCSTTIPGHILGNMWAQTWSGIYDLVVPFPDAKHQDIDRILKQQQFHPLQLQRKAEEFYVSLGFDPMPSDFWTKSVFVKSSKTLMNCHPTAFDFHKEQDFRVKMCMENISSNYYWKVTHHEMGHLVYYMAYRGQPDVYRRPANPALDEAIGDTITMSSLTLEHMHRLGFTKDKPANIPYENDINLLMYQALEKIPMIAFSYILDKWRWNVYRGVISPSKYTESWVHMRRHIQGIHPPVSRSELDFDPGSKYHVAANIPYIRYFFSVIVQYQIHEALCQEAGQTGPLNHCDISNSKEAGEKLRSFMRLGSSVPWPNSLKLLTGRISISTRAIRSYFAVLFDWLTAQNQPENPSTSNGKGHDTC